ncbi:uncharacterized protein BYT42DRAFT_610135 [Radiomyces spectabilis]|uniref:uncharacterized protein n=1 Tax=Radiomyces spectabilis TaxID=64574 RepID=UPI00221F3883|nr:uncharacterized protein BYT42DRAFT_610135 [Radiomyces spectabilis]KAI8390863.1 hypothetical protein BYT42DRAFT_610135 [Radiomyces spectabilis]
MANLHGPVDIGDYLQEFLSSIDDLPGEICFLLTELQSKDHEFQKVLRNIHNRQVKMFSIQRKTADKPDASFIPIEEETSLKREVQRYLNRAEQLVEEKGELADRAKQLIEKHLNHLDQDLEALYPHHNIRKASEREAAAWIARISAASSNSLMQCNDFVTPTSHSHTTFLPLDNYDRGRSQAARRKRTMPPSTIPNSYARTHDTMNDWYAFPHEKATFEYQRQPIHRPPYQNGALRYNQGTYESYHVPTEYEHVSPDDDEKYCICQTSSNGLMIACDNEHCSTEWFHLECVGLTVPPEGVWYCPACHLRASFGMMDYLSDDRQERDSQLGAEIKGEI